jgi:quercetin dioxygenase-like cupin family protein/DNA-binding XRE family transcriptional regulator
MPKDTRSLPPPRIGERIRSRRLELQMTLKECAAATGLSVAFLSLAERDKSMPSLVSLLRIGKALNVEIAYFMEIPPNDSIVRRASSPQVVKLDSPLAYHELASNMANRTLDIWLITVPPGYVYPVETRPGEHFRYVIKGELYSKAGEIETVLKRGDSMHFDARLPHSAENRTDQEVVFLCVATPSSF